jgi:hypothetical protein
MSLSHLKDVINSIHQTFVSPFAHTIIHANHYNIEDA